MQDYYAVLGVPENASQDDIAKAYREKARQYHPDLNPDGADEFKKVAEAHETLNNPDKRRHYDLSRKGGHPGIPFRTPFGDDPFMNSFFRSSHRRRRQESHAAAQISFKEAISGCVTKVTVHQPKVCDICHGSGVRRTQRCEQCQGHGFLSMSQPPFQVQVPCGACRGTGNVPIELCTCDHGFSGTDTITADVEIPAGVHSGMTMRIQDKIGPDTDLLVHIQVQDHPYFTHEHDDLICTYPVSYHQLVLGDTIEVPGMNGKISVKIPAGTVAGSKVRIKGHGSPSIRTPGTTGDLYINLKLEMPADDEYKRLVEQLKEIEKKHTEPLLKKFEVV